MIYGNTAILNVHDTVLNSCNVRIVSGALDFAVLSHSLCSLALSVTVPLPLLYCLFSVPFSCGLLAGLGLYYLCGCLPLMEMVTFPSPWPGVLLLFPRKGPEENWATTHLVRVEICVPWKAVRGKQFSEGTEGQGEKSPPADKVLWIDLSPKSTVLAVSPHLLLRVLQKTQIIFPTTTAWHGAAVLLFLPRRWVSLIDNCNSSLVIPFIPRKYGRWQDFLWQIAKFSCWAK